jgi:GDP-mannose 6-dehydrogenase
MSNPMLSSVSVFGLGYVGCVSAACLASRGHRTIGVDVNPDKMECLRQGRAPVVEAEIGDLTARVVAAGDLKVMADAHEAVTSTDISLVCVGTPSGAGGALSTTSLQDVTARIGAALADVDRWHVVVYRSTMVPGTCENLLIPELERASGKRAGVDFGVCVNPEFLREGTSVPDFCDPPKTVVGYTDTRSSEMVLGLYEGLPGPRFQVPIRVAEMTKYVDNSFHALKIGFSNEVGAICAALGMDSHAVMDIFTADAKLNISPAYLRPGFAFGGSCLPKDLRALVHTARRNDVDVPVLANVLASNEARMRQAVDLVLADGRRRVGIFGLAFKPGTDDLRESPMVELAERLIGKGFDVKIHDANVILSRLMGANRAFIDERLPHIGELLTGDVGAVVEHADVLIAGSREPAVVDALSAVAPQQLLLDLVRLPNADTLRASCRYMGIGW